MTMNQQQLRSLKPKHEKKAWILLLFLLPSLLYVAIFSYAPMYGLQIAFRNYKISSGFFGSEWVGFKHLSTFFSSYRFSLILINTLRVSLYYMAVGFPFPIIFAMLCNYVRSERRKKFIQTASYAPYFVSTVVLVSMMAMFFSPSSGFVNSIRKQLGYTAFNYFASADAFPHMYVWSSVWQNMGWSAVIYISALSSVDPMQHEAAIIDGATILQRIRHIDFPAILPTIVILLILQAGSILGVGYEKVYLMQNNSNLATSEVISTYSYKIGLESNQYSYSTAIGLFNNVVNFILVITVNQISKKVSSISIF